MKLDKAGLTQITSSGFAVLLTILFTLLFLGASGYIGLFHNRGITAAMNKSGYYEGLYQDITDSTAVVAAEAGLPASVLTDVITLKKVYINGINSTEALLRGEEAVILTDSLSEKLKANMNQYIISQGKAVTEETEQRSKAFLDRIRQVYQDRLQLKFMRDLYQLRRSYRDRSMLLVPILVVLISVLCFFIIRTQRHFYLGIRYITCSMIAASLLILLTGTALSLIRPFSSLALSPEYYQSFIEAAGDSMIKVLLLLAQGGLTISLALILVTGYLKSRVSNQLRNIQID